MLFLHNTSHVEDEPYPNLLQGKGFGGFPSLAFLDAQGEVLAQPSGRDVADFEATLAALLKWQALKAKTDRTAAEEVEYFFAELDLGKLSLDDAKARYAKLDELTDAQKATVESELIVLEADELRKRAGRDRAKVEEANAAIAAMAKAGRTPTGPRAMRFWGAVMAHADKAKDVELFEQAVNAARATYGDDPGAAPYLKRLTDRLAELKRGEAK